MSEEMFPVNDAQLEQVVYDVLQEDDELEGTPNQRLQLLIPRRLVYGEVDDQQHHPLLDDGNDNLIAEAAADVENNESEESTVVTTSFILENRVRFTKANIIFLFDKNKYIFSFTEKLIGLSFNFSFIMNKRLILDLGVV
ncbi:uncharacterized protein LOC142329356 [Lycorma delicatula]|uniref:uncharacterized protein LOC142329356 n=1 Tax=Lycorma delicatula TaxID=130591 RepID=UPI003F5133BF